MRKMMTRRTAREILVKIFYQADVNNDCDSTEYVERVSRAEDLREYVSTCDSEESEGPVNAGDQMNFIKAVCCAWDLHRAEIDEDIRKYSINWKLERMARIDVAILREAITEVRYIDDVPDAVAINEAVELAKIYGTDKSPKFINAVLGKVAEAEDE